ncbi:MAG: hypothetical protein IID36_06110 [Planctomycetes bacterium]|nr:hypothetical protein [Planctomycetota bacterium]
MAIDPSRFHAHSVADTCAVWNILSARALYAASRAANCTFCVTRFVQYECLYKGRTQITKAENELQRRLRREQQNGSFQPYHLDVADLQDVELLARRHNLSKGELSSIAFAKKTRQAFLTDDQKARTLAARFLNQGMVQTTPHLFGWLIFTGRLSDGDKDLIVEEHTEHGRPLAQYFNEAYEEALRCRLMAR